VSSALALRALEPQALAQALALGVLLCARLAPLAWLVPWAAARNAPPLVSIALVAVLALCLWPAAASAAPVLPLSLLSLLVLAVRELLIGVVYALALALPLRALEWAGRFAGHFAGAAGAETAYASLQLWLGVAAFFALGGHRVAIAALVHGIVQRPIGVLSPLRDFSGVALGSASLFGEAFASALLIALPVAAALALTDLGVALAARGAAAPTLPLVLAPGRAALALLVVWITIMLLIGSLPEVFEHGLRAARRLWGTL
jgi:flagellar biosynthetic protein FliR